jgi:hypothetical protein
MTFACLSCPAAKETDDRLPDRGEPNVEADLTHITRAVLASRMSDTGGRKSRHTLPPTACEGRP